MATKNATQAYAGTQDGSAMVYSWTLNASDVGAPVEMSEWADRSVQIGTTGDNFNAAAVLLEGSNDGVLYQTLKDPAGNPITTTSSILRQVLESTRYIRPSAAAGVTSVRVYLFVRRASSLRT